MKGNVSFGILSEKSGLAGQAARSIFLRDPSLRSGCHIVSMLEMVTEMSVWATNPD